MNVSTVYLWLNECEAEWLTEPRLKEVLLGAVKAGNFDLLYSHVSTHDGRVVALAVVGESHVVLHADVAARSICAEVLSCTTKTAAQAAIDHVGATIPHVRANHEWVNYEVVQGFEEE